MAAITSEGAFLQRPSTSEGDHILTISCRSSYGELKFMYKFMSTGSSGLHLGPEFSEKKR